MEVVRKLNSVDLQYLFFFSFFVHPWGVQIPQRPPFLSRKIAYNKGMKIMILLILLLLSFSSFAHDCDKKVTEEKLISDWKVEIEKSVRIYGRFSEYTIENFTKTGNKGHVELHKLKRECKKFQYSLSQDLSCKARVNLDSITNCQRKP